MNTIAKIVFEDASVLYSTEYAVWKRTFLLIFLVLLLKGLDIGDVDLIVCYDASTSPTRMVQVITKDGITASCTNSITTFYLSIFICVSSLFIRPAN